MSKTLSFKFSCVAALLLFAKITGAQTKHVVQVGDNFFNPSQFTANVGDTVRWTFIAGSMENHTTTSSSIPSGAASWNSLVNTANPSFDYIITQAGAYSYVCTPHASMGMVGSFTASPATSVPTISGKTPSIIAPNPAKSTITVAAGFEKAHIRIVDMQGRVVKSWQNQNSQKLDISGTPAGLYTVTLQKEKAIYQEKLIVLE